MKRWYILLLSLSLFHHGLSTEEIPDDELRFFGAITNMNETVICSVILISPRRSFSSETCVNATVGFPEYNLRKPVPYIPSLNGVTTTNDPNFEGDNGFHMALYTYNTTVQFQKDLSPVTYTVKRVRPGDNCYTAKWTKNGKKWKLLKIPISTKFKDCAFIEKFYQEHFGEIYLEEDVCSWIAVSAETNPEVELESTLDPKLVYPLLCADQLANDTLYGLLIDRKTTNGTVYHIWKYMASIYEVINLIIASTGEEPETFPEMEKTQNETIANDTIALNAVDAVSTTRKPRPVRNTLAFVKKVLPSTKYTPRLHDTTPPQSSVTQKKNLTLPTAVHRAKSGGEMFMPALFVLLCAFLVGKLF